MGSTWRSYARPRSTSTKEMTVTVKEITSEMLGRPLTPTEELLVGLTTTIVNGSWTLREHDRAAMQADAAMLGEQVTA